MRTNGDGSAPKPLSVAWVGWLPISWASGLMTGLIIGFGVGVLVS